MTEENQTKACLYCAETVNIDAKKCKHCGEILDIELRVQREHQNKQQPLQPKWSSGTATLLSFIIPGAGQMYKGKVGAGIAWLIFTTVGYGLLIVPGVILHIICIVKASSGNIYEKN